MPKSKGIGVNPDVHELLIVAIIFVSLRTSRKCLSMIEQDANVCSSVIEHGST